MKNIMCALCIIVVPLFAEFNRTTGLIDIPTARVLPHLGYRIGVDASAKLGNGEYSDIFEENEHISLGLGNMFEVYLDIYTVIETWTAAIGFCHNFYNSRKISLAWGVHQISYDLNVSEIAHGDSTGWHDDLLYYREDYEKPYELGSAFIVSTYAVDERLNLTLGIGRGRYVGYGQTSRYFNTNFYHDRGGDWAFGLFGGLDIAITRNLYFILDGDGRDINVGFVYERMPWEFGLALTKCEYFADWDEYRPRVAASISYVKVKLKPKPGIIAGTVTDEQGNPIVAEVGILNVDVPKAMTEPEKGSYRFVSMQPTIYNVYAWANGYEQQDKKVEVVSGKTVRCDFVLTRIMPLTGNIVGHVLDSLTGAPLSGRVSLTEAELSTRSDDSGAFTFAQLAPDVYTIAAEVPGYIPVSRRATVYAGQTTELVIMMLKPPPVISLRGVKFDFDGAVVKPESYPILDEAARILKEYSSLKVEIQGHTDAIGPDEYNLKLSYARAQSVLKYFESKHKIEPSRFTVRGYGESTPVATNETEEGRALNRRVDLVISE